jgi:hypothetical protein
MSWHGKTFVKLGWLEMPRSPSCGDPKLDLQNDHFHGKNDGK